MMPTPDESFANWHGIINNDFCTTIRETFKLPSSSQDTYTYHTDSFAMTLSEIESSLSSNPLKYKYQVHGKAIEVCYTSSSPRKRIAIGSPLN